MSIVSEDLDCEISRSEKGRIIVGERELKDLFELVNRWHSELLIRVPKERMDYLNKNSPKISAEYSDGSIFELVSIDSLIGIRTNKQKRLKELKIGNSLYGGVEITLQGESKYRDPARIKISGPQALAEHAVLSLQEILREKRDFTYYLEKIPSPVYGIAVTLVFIFSAYQFANDHSVRGFWTAIAGFAFAVWIWSSMAVSSLRNRWLSPVVFLWGVHERDYIAAKSAAKVIGVIIPGWILTNLLLPKLLATR